MDAEGPTWFVNCSHSQGLPNPQIAPVQLGLQLGFHGVGEASCRA